MSEPWLLRGAPADGAPLGTLGSVAARVGAVRLSGDPGLRLCGAAADTRAVRPGDLFCAVRGDRVDAHALLPEAWAAGAAAALVDRAPGAAWSQDAVPAGRGVLLVPGVVPALGRLAAARLRDLGGSPRVVGVTGSVGKTTTAALLAAALSAGGEVLVPDRSFNTEISLPLVCLRAAARHRFAVLELAMRGPGQIAYLAEVAHPRVGVITRIGESHLEVMGSIEAIAAAKGELLRALPPDGLAVLNADDPRQAPMAAWSPAPVRTYGLAADADARGTDLRMRPGGGWCFEAHLRACGRRVPVEIGLLGRHHVWGALAALCVAEALGCDPAEAASRLEGVRPERGRLAVVPAGRLRLLDDTFNAAPLSVLAALDTLVRLAPPGARAAVLGDMLDLGTATVPGHREVGRGAAAAELTWLLAVGPLAAGIADAALEAGAQASAVHRVPDVESAAALLPGLLAALPDGAAVLFKASHAAGLERLVAAVEARP